MEGAKDYLSQIKYIDEDIRSRQEEIERLKSSLLIKTSTIKEDVVQESRAGHYDDKYIKLLEEMEKMNKRIDELVDLKVEVTNRIDLIEDRRYRIILREYYLNMRTFESIAGVMHYNSRHVQRLHEEALEAMEDVIECRVPL